MTDAWAETDVWPLPRYSGDSKAQAAYHPGDGPESTESPAPSFTSGARGSLVERLAEAIYLASDPCGCEAPTPWVDLSPSRQGWFRSVVAPAVLPLVEAHAAAEVEAAVSVVRAERDEALDQVRGFQAMRWPEEAHRLQQQRNALREKVAKVEALADEFTRRQQRNAAHNGGVVCSVWGLAGGELDHALSDPTTPDQTEEQS